MNLALLIVICGQIIPSNQKPVDSAETLNEFQSSVHAIYANAGHALSVLRITPSDNLDAIVDLERKLTGYDQAINNSEDSFHRLAERTQRRFIAQFSDTKPPEKVRWKAASSLQPFKYKIPDNIQITEQESEIVIYKSGLAKPITATTHILCLGHEVWDGTLIRATFQLRADDPRFRNSHIGLRDYAGHSAHLFRVQNTGNETLTFNLYLMRKGTRSTALLTQTSDTAEQAPSNAVVARVERKDLVQWEPSEPLFISFSFGVRAKYAFQQIGVFHEAEQNGNEAVK